VPGKAPAVRLGSEFGREKTAGRSSLKSLRYVSRIEEMRPVGWSPCRPEDLIKRAETVVKR